MWGAMLLDGHEVGAADESRLEGVSAEDSFSRPVSVQQEAEERERRSPAASLGFLFI